MKASVMKKKENGVSPVIATILMVAITVVLAATLYIMVGNMNSQSNTNLLAGSLTYEEYFSNPKNGTATFILSMSTPQRASLGDLMIKVLNANGSIINDANISIEHIVSENDQTHIIGGDHIKIVYAGHDIHGYQIIMSVSGYTGTITGNIPS